MTTGPMRRVLVANRGEIALRVIRACREEGLESVAVYSEADRLSPHVRAADRAVYLGEAAAAASYLNIERIVEVARGAGADAVHPGYGFLAERAEFADAVTAAGLIFIGPSPEAIRAMGEKTEARRRMQEAGVPVVPGTVEPVSDVHEATRVAEEIGFPLLLKAVAGGGGKGMRLVRGAAELESNFRQAVSEAEKAFGNGAVYVERFVEHPRHVEIQVLGDSLGNVMHVGERECSVQRRHQKLVEEAPSPAVTQDLRERMGQAAVKAAQSVRYVGAGTVEFLLAPDGVFYFLEMNTRIQVEHPVTEMVYGIDLVREQIRIARGGALSFADRSLRPRGHAIECRITSEDPSNAFLPATGLVEHLRIPSGPGVRWDGGIEVGNHIGLHYDPLLAKLVVWAEDRDQAIHRMQRALDELMIVGVATSQSFHRRVMADPVFRSGDYTIQYLEDRADALALSEVEEHTMRLAVVAAVLAEEQRRKAARPVTEATQTASRWAAVARREGLR